MSEVDERLLLSKQLTARAIGISVQAFSQWGLQPYKRSGREALFYIPDVIQELIRRRSPDPDAELDLEQERARLAKEQADKTALENAERRSEIADLATIAEVWGQLFTSFRARMLAAPSKLAPQVNPENPNLARDIIAAEHERILSELAAYQSEAGAAEHDSDAQRDAGDPAPTAAANGKRVGGSLPPTKRGKQRRARPVQH